jgi:hypothetical protein
MQLSPCILTSFPITQPENYIATPPRRQRALDANADFAEVTSPCPKVIHFPFEFHFVLVFHPRDSNIILSFVVLDTDAPNM